MEMYQLQNINGIFSSHQGGSEYIVTGDWPFPTLSLHMKVKIYNKMKIYKNVKMYKNVKIDKNVKIYKNVKRQIKK